MCGKPWPREGAERPLFSRLQLFETALGGEAEQSAGQLKIDEALGVGNRDAFPPGDAHEPLAQGCRVGFGFAGEENVDVVGGKNAAAMRFSDLDDGKHRMTLLRVLVDEREDEVSTVAAEARDVFDGMIGFAADDVEAGLLHGLAVSERRVRRALAQDQGPKFRISQQRVAFGQEE